MLHKHFSKTCHFTHNFKVLYGMFHFVPAIIILKKIDNSRISEWKSMGVIYEGVRETKSKNSLEFISNTTG